MLKTLIYISIFSLTLWSPYSLSNSCEGLGENSNKEKLFSCISELSKRVESIASTKPDLSAYVKKSDLHASPDLSPYARKSDLHAAPDLSSYAKKSELPASLCNKEIKLEVGDGDKFLFYLTDHRVENLTHNYGGAKGNKWFVRCQ